MGSVGGAGGFFSVLKHSRPSACETARGDEPPGASSQASPLPRKRLSAAPTDSTVFSPDGWIAGGDEGALDHGVELLDAEDLVEAVEELGGKVLRERVRSRDA